MVLLEKDRHAPSPVPGRAGPRKAAREEPWELQEGSEVGLPCKLLGLSFAASKLGSCRRLFPRADACCFPILHSAPVPRAPLQLKMNLSHWSLQGSEPSAPRSKHGLACRSPPTPCPLLAGLSAAGAILHLLSASLLPRGQVWARAKHQRRHALPQTCHGAADTARSSPATAKRLPAPPAHGQFADTHGWK